MWRVDSTSVTLRYKLEDMLLMGPTETDRAESMPFKMWWASSLIVNWLCSIVVYGRVLKFGLYSVCCRMWLHCFWQMVCPRIGFCWTFRFFMSVRDPHATPLYPLFMMVMLLFSCTFLKICNSHMFALFPVCNFERTCPPFSKFWLMCAE